MSDPLAWLVLTNLMKTDLATRIQLWGELADTAKHSYTRFRAKQEFYACQDQYRLLEYHQDDLRHDLANINEL